jgi:hypothetical protein
MIRPGLMRIRALIVVLVLLIAGVSSGARLTTVTAVPDSGRRTATVRARRVDGSAEPLEHSIIVPGITDLAMGEGLWEIRVVGEGLWAAPAYLRNEDSTAVRVWPTVPLTGTAKGVSALRVGFLPLDQNSAAGEVDCAVDHEEWKCSVPTGRYDLRFSSSGFAPEYRFAVIAKADAKPLLLNFVPGASLSGSVEAVTGAKIPADGVEILLTSAIGESAAWKQTAHSNAKGFFQFKGVAPGDYSIRGEAKGLTTQSESVKMRAGAAAELNTPLLLDAPKRLTVAVMPRLDPSGNRWRMRLISNNARLRHGDILAESAVTEEGQWTHPKLIAGNYSVEVLTANGEQWSSQDVTIGRDDVTVAVTALAAKITGLITLGDRPLKASLSFPDEWGVKVQSDSDGQFTGQIPPDDRNERMILVEAETPHVKRTIRTKVEKNEAGDLHLVINLPTTTLMGRVMNEDRSPEPHAFLTVTQNDSAVFEQMFVEPDGSFQIGGFEPGDYWIKADAGERTSKSVEVKLRRDSSSEVELMLRRVEVLHGRMTMGQTPAIAADIYVFPRDTWADTWVTGLPHATTNESGYFEMELPPGTKIFDGLAVHPAFDIIIGRATMQQDQQLRVATQQIGGTLILESKSDDVLLIHGGGEMYASWVANKAGGTVAPGQMIIPRLQPGQYSACLKDKGRCVSGYLPPHGTLTLSLAAAN